MIVNLTSAIREEINYSVNEIYCCTLAANRRLVLITKMCSYKIYNKLQLIFNVANKTFNVGIIILSHD